MPDRDEDHLNQLDTKKLMVAFGWTRDNRPFTTAELERVYDWALNPETPRDVLDAVLDGTTAIDVVEGKIVLKKRRNMDAKELRNAFEKLAEIHTEEDDVDPHLN